MRPAFMLCALLAGGTVGPDYVKPQVDTPQKYRFQDSTARDTANTDWWKQFDDPVLDGLISEALAHNKNIQIAAANVAQAAAVLTQTRSQFFPQVGYSSNAARPRASESNLGPLGQRFIDNPQNSYEVLASASWEIDLWGRIRRQTEAAHANVLATEQARSRYETAATQIPQIETGIAQTENALSILLGRQLAAQPRDRIEVHRNGYASVVDVFHVAGIGGAQVKRPPSGWPSAVIVRLQGFPELESFQATGGAGTLDCEVNRVERRSVQHRCILGGADVAALSRTAEYFQVELPPALLAADGASVELHWVDQWR